MAIAVAGTLAFAAPASAYSKYDSNGSCTAYIYWSYSADYTYTYEVGNSCRTVGSWHQYKDGSVMRATAWDFDGKYSQTPVRRQMVMHAYSLQPW